MESADFSCAAGANVTAAYTGEGTCTTELVAASAGGAPLSGRFVITVSSSIPSNDDLTDDTAWGTAVETTAFLDHNATATEVRTVLEALSSVAAADVELVNFLPSGNGSAGSTYLVTFTGASGAASPIGGLSLTASAAGLNGTGAETTVGEVHPGSRWGGEFALSIGGLEGSALPFDARAEDMQEAVSALLASAGGENDENSVEVWREDYEAGFRWIAAFSGGDLDGDVNLMEVRCSVLGDGGRVCWHRATHVCAFARESPSG